MVDKKIIFRADGNQEIGLGHLFRMVALAEMYKEDYEFVFLTKESSLRTVIPIQYQVDIIPEEILVEFEPNWILEKYSPSEYSVIADGYHFGSAYQKKIKQHDYLLMYVDDLVQEHMYADIVVNHSSHVRQEDYQAEPYTQFALGTDYAMLRPSFLEEAKKERKIDSLDTAFICFGGADVYDFSYKLVKALVSFEEFKEINVVLGDAYSHYEIHQIQDERLKIHKNLSEKEMLSLIKHCNFAIAPASTILFELSCLKIPILSGYYADNQKMFHDFLEKNNYVTSLGNFRETDTKRIIKQIKFVLSKPNLNTPKLIDGYSKERFQFLIRKFFTNKLTLGDLTFTNYTNLSNQQKLQVLKYRNDISVRKWMNNSLIIEEEDHLIYVDKLRTLKDRIYWAVFKNKKIIGSVYITDIEEVDYKTGNWGFFLNPKLIGYGLGVEIEFEFLKLIFEFLKFDEIYGFSFKENENTNIIQKLFCFEVEEQSSSMIKTTLTRNNNPIKIDSEYRVDRNSLIRKLRTLR